MRLEEIMNKIICDDCLAVMKGLPDKCIDLVLTDPPYEFISKNPQWWGFMNKENKKHLQNLNESFWMSYNPIEYLEQCKRICKVFNWYFFTNKSLLTTYINWAENNNYKWELIIWIKDNPVPINNWHYLIDKEYVVYIKESGAYFDSKLWYDNYFTWIKYPIWIKDFDHPTVKPLKIIKRIMEISSKKWDIIFDGYMGSGTTAVAAKELSRDYIWSELNQEYVDIANERLKTTTMGLF